MSTLEDRYNPQAKRLLEMALREALSMGHNYIGPEHVLLAFARLMGESSIGTDVLVDLRIDGNALRNTVLTRLQAKPPTIEERVAALEARVLDPGVPVPPPREREARG